MLTEQQLNNYADVLLWGMKTARSEPFQAGDAVLVRYDLPARRLTEILFERLLDMGVHPVQRITASPAMEHSFFTRASEPQLTYIAPGEEELTRSLNGAISLLAPESLTHLQDVDPEHIGRAVLAKKKLRDILDERENQGEFGWTLCLLPTEELATNAGLAPQEYAGQIIKACYLDYPDPVREWQRIFSEAGEIKEFLNSLDIERIRVESDRCDLELSPGRERQWVGISGHNIPSFEIFTSPDWRSTRGVFFMDQPSFRSGNLVRNLRLEFEDGRVSKVEAETGQEFVEKQLTIDENSDKLGEFSLTDTRFSRIDRFMAHTLFDENFGGTYGNCHIALGASYAETYARGGKNLTPERKEDLGFNDSALHWDLVNTERKRVTARLSSGQTRTIYEDGRFLL
jgi:aminopeptidase